MPRHRTDLRSIARSAILCLTAFATSASAQPAIVTCNIAARDAWLTAKSRGWQSHCAIFPNLGNPTITAELKTYSPNRIACRLYTGQGGVFPKSAQASFFVKPANLPGGLRNGWSLSSYNVSGLATSAGVSTQALIVRNADSNLQAVKTTYYIYLDQIRLKKTAGNCSNAVQEAF